MTRSQVGEIIYRDPTTLRGYWRTPEATTEGFRHPTHLVALDGSPRNRSGKVTNGTLREKDPAST